MRNLLLEIGADGAIEGCSLMADSDRDELILKAALSGILTGKTTGKQGQINEQWNGGNKTYH